ncbi:uncharacterized protein LAESUDRAFT_765467 [Laetiporus sulphureus 93-53]|uniref:Uncharacterized protein n=1 Tax=Laetiporus sulphureus 93-53 TaxID=1314785 RepID=A0A165AR19_9APHY|nr:uncharacterized protein LAESUDRAFT_765467 [Laetiporus sulphureus 93-53]KZS99494.1 hypothetical protein LAESUDRAFT_765467 [Laetiporus sulphureus 93-53]
MRPSLLSLAAVAACVLPIYAQLITTTDEYGYTVVELITLDPLGLVTTSIESTILAGALTDTATDTDTELTTALTTTARTTAPTTTTTPLTTTTMPVAIPTTTTTTPAVVVGAPTSTEAGLTTYYYTTTDAAGATEVILATFTPTFAPTTIPAAPSHTGTILDYSQWLSLIGASSSATVSGGSELSSSSGASPRWSTQRGWMGVGTVTGLLGGTWLLLV